MKKEGLASIYDLAFTFNTCTHKQRQEMLPKAYQPSEERKPELCLSSLFAQATEG